MSRGDRVHDPAFHHFASQLRRRPVAHRDPAVLGLLAGHRDDRRELFGREPCRCSRSRQVRQDGANLDAQVSVGRGLLFGCRQRRLCVAPAITPLSDRASGALEPLRLLLVARTVGTRQHDRGSFCQPPRRASRHDQLRQDRALTRRHRDAPGSSRHGWTSSWVPSLHAGRRAKFSGNKFRRAGLGWARGPIRGWCSTPARTSIQAHCDRSMALGISPRIAGPQPLVPTSAPLPESQPTASPPRSRHAPPTVQRFVSMR